MPASGLFPVKYLGPDRYLVVGSFTTANGAAPTATTGRGFTVARTGEGVWSVTLDDAPSSIEAVFLTVAPKTLTKLNNVTEDVDARTSTVISIQLFTAAATQTAHPVVDDDPGSIISFMIVCRRTNVTDATQV